MPTNKFSKITFPFFGLLKKPYEINITFDKIQIRRLISSPLETLDDKNLEGDFFARLFQLEKRNDFSVTCKDIQECLNSKVKWGLDKNAIIHDLSKLETIPAKTVKIKYVKENLIWFYNISYPFKIHTNQDLSFDDKDVIYGRLLFINNEWYLKEFSMSPNPKNYERV